MPCPHCQGTWAADTKFIDKDLKAALAWFKTSTPPEKPFRLNKFTMIDDPKKLWAHLKEEIVSNNIYVLERIREDLIKLCALFEGEEF